MASIRRRSVTVLLVSASGVAMAYWLFSPVVTQGTLAGELVAASGEREVAIASDEAIEWPVHINRPEGAPRIDTGMVDGFGQPITVSCMSCHGNLTPNVQTRRGDELASFHTGLTFNHGELSCLTCHNAENYNTLTLAGGAALAFADVQQLCAQCHAPQARDFERSAHGGSSGYWDMSRGPQMRKNCIDCHDPHAPAFPSMVPTFKPRDRFLRSDTQKAVTE